MDLEFLGDSSCIKAAGFSHGYLTIQFQDDSMYTYEGVDASTWRGLKISTSKGWYYNKNIRNSYSFFEGTHEDEGPLKYIDSKYFDDLSDNLTME